MYGLIVAGQVLVLVLMGAASYWGSKRIDPETRVAARLGTSGVDWTMGKKTALWWTPLIGFVVLLGTLAVNDSPERDTIAVLGLGILGFLLLAHWSAVKRAAR